MRILFEGKLATNDAEFNVQTLALQNLPQIMALQNSVVNSLESKEFLQPLTIGEYEYILNGNGLMIGAFVENELIAFRALLVPSVDVEHLGYDIHLKEEDLSRVIYQEISIVHPNYRGNRLQQTLALLIMEELGHSKTYDYVCCTVAPFNIPSLKDKFAQQMEIAALKQKYGGQLRYVFVKNLLETHHKDWTEIKTIPMGDIAGQQELLADGWRGIQIEKLDEEYWVHYGRM